MSKSEIIETIQSADKALIADVEAIIAIHKIEADLRLFEQQKIELALSAQQYWEERWACCE